jgi:hypothetical protein
MQAPIKYTGNNQQLISIINTNPGLYRLRFVSPEPTKSAKVKNWRNDKTHTSL